MCCILIAFLDSSFRPPLFLYLSFCMCVEGCCDFWSYLTGWSCLGNTSNHSNERHNLQSDDILKVLSFHLVFPSLSCFSASLYVFFFSLSLFLFVYVCVCWGVCETNSKEEEGWNRNTARKTSTNRKYRGGVCVTNEEVGESFPPLSRFSHPWL